MPRSKRGQSLVEYALGIGCVMAVCTLALSFIGHVYGDNFLSPDGPSKYEAKSVNSPGHHSQVLKTANAPWVLN